ncbi:HAD-IIIA family hydrolase [Pseudomonas sp. KNUC1026]|uniref:HAD-IIIA family hydrolase n=1 Tax=Pseudomonas sp. KNUC1026 TaxID=2893890 RepID=UPI001F2F7BE1|nr:HAD-IIIA family hydrolase [Pseudomonas sp. KNUC1026]UFH48503.1 HAD-IIIA family hydrolase [Pseudomonas sp. KNUC1026]
MREFDLIVFDWDGTLADSIGRIVDAMEHAAVAGGLQPCATSAIKGIIGLELSQAISQLHPMLDDQALHAFRQRYADRYMAMDAEPSPLFPGVAHGLQQFREQGYQLAVATGKARRGLDRVLRAHGLETFFDITRAADETESKPAPRMLREILEHCGVEPARAVMVGDSAFDIQMAHNAGVASVAVGYGAIELGILRQYEPTHAIEAFQALEPWLAGRR